MVAKIDTTEQKRQQLRKDCEEDFMKFTKVVAPERVFGEVHKEFAQFLMESSSLSTYSLGLLPRGHQKSAIAALYVAWRIVKNPAITIVYLSATSYLAEKQLRAIKRVLESDIVRTIWKNIIEKEEAKREKWTTSEICVDHPTRKSEGVRDSTVLAAGITTNITGGHCDLLVLDDLVVPKNNNVVGREQVLEAYAQFSSILNPDGEIIAVGTRYHPKDIYETFKETKEDVFDEEGYSVGSKNVWRIFERQVETDGNFLWSRQQRADGKWFGFDERVLARIRSGYKEDPTQFYAQYYNNPNKGSASALTEEYFRYYEPNKLKCVGRDWFYAGKRLSIFAAIDFAYSVSAASDFTSIVTVGIDEDRIYYILDIQRFKTNKILDYYNKLMQVNNKYGIKLVSAECTAAQDVIVEELKRYIRDFGVRLRVENTRPTKNKEERILSTLRPLYEDLRIMHYKGGECEELEKELVQVRPAHDDIKDALASAIAITVPPSKGLLQAVDLDNLMKKAFGISITPTTNSKYGAR